MTAHRFSRLAAFALLLAAPCSATGDSEEISVPYYNPEPGPCCEYIIFRFYGQEYPEGPDKPLPAASRESNNDYTLDLSVSVEPAVRDDPENVRITSIYIYHDSLFGWAHPIKVYSCADDSPPSEGIVEYPRDTDPSVVTIPASHPALVHDPGGCEWGVIVSCSGLVDPPTGATIHRCIRSFTVGCCSCECATCEATGQPTVTNSADSGGGLTCDIPMGAADGGDTSGFVRFQTSSFGDPNSGAVAAFVPSTYTTTVEQGGGILVESPLTTARTSTSANTITITQHHKATGKKFRESAIVFSAGKLHAESKLYGPDGTSVVYTTRHEQTMQSTGTSTTCTLDSGSYSSGSFTALRRESLKITLDPVSGKQTRRQTVSELVGGSFETVSDVETVWTNFPWGWEKTGETIDPGQGGASLTSTWTYYGPGDNTAQPDDPATTEGYSRLKSYARYDGYLETHHYWDNHHLILRPFADGATGTADGLTIDREWQAAGDTSTITITRSVNGKTLSREATTYDESDRTVETTTHTGTDTLVTTTTLKPSGQDFGGLPQSVAHPDDTTTTYSYTRHSQDGGKKIVKQTGSGALSRKTTTTYNCYGTAIRTIEEAGTSSVVVYHTAVTSVDDFGRPLLTEHFPGSSSASDGQIQADTTGDPACQTAATYSCCGLASETDRYGITTDYQYDGLRRRTATTRLGLTTETVYAGLTTSTHRYPDGGSAGDGNRMTKTVRNLAATSRQNWSRSAADGDLILASSTTTDYQPAAGLSRREVTTYVTTPDDDSQPVQTTEYYLDGRTCQTYGDMAPHTRHAYAVGSTGLETTRSHVDGANEYEAVTTTADWAGREVRVDYADTASATMEYNALGQLAKSVDPDGVATLYAYNAAGERTTTAIDLDRDGSIDYGADTVRFRETIPVSAHAESNGVLRTVTKVWKSGGTELVVAHNDRAATGLKTWEISYPEGDQPETSSTVTNLGTPGDGDWTVTGTDPSGAGTVSTYTDGLLDKMETFKSGGGSAIETTSYAYDTRNRPTHVHDARTGTTVTAYYDSNVDVVASITEPGSRTTAFAYDDRGRRTLVNAPDTLDEEGNTLDNETTTTYFPDGSVEEVAGDQTYRRRHTYDYARRMDSLTTYGTETATTTWTYDQSRGWLDRKQYDDGNGTDYTYTNAGRLKTRTWARDVDGGNDPNKDQLTTTYAYDNGGRLDTVTYNDSTPTIDYSYDHHGRVATVEQDGLALHSYTYNTSDLLLDKETISYDSNGNEEIDSGDLVRVIDREYEDGSPSTIARRPAGFELRESDSATNPITDHAVGYHYESDIDRLLGVDASGVPNLDGESYAFEYTYGVTNSARLLSNVTGPAHTAANTWLGDRDALDKKENKVGQSVRSSYDYTVNALSQRTGLSTAGSAFGGTAPSVDWRYNSRGELVSADDDRGATHDRHYTFDAIGNRDVVRTGTASSTGGTATNYTPNELNQYTGASQNFDYDLDGNLIGGTLHSGALTTTLGTTCTATLAWNAENRLVEVEDDGTVVTYSHDFQGRRISRTAGETTTWYIYDGWNLIAEYNGTTLSRTYTWGLDLSGTMQGAGGVGGLLALTTTTTSFYPAYDGNGNVSEYLNSAGVVQAHFEYDPFGNLIANTDTNGDFPIRFSTKMLEDETGLYYYGYRDYDPVTGRWPSRDPIEEHGGLNLYGFVNNDGVDWVDYLGLFNPGQGGYPGPVKPEKFDCEKACENQNKFLDRLDAMGSNKEPDCSGETGCALVTVVIDIGDPCSNEDKDLGHVGVGVGNVFYDSGPGGVVPWWGGNPPSGKFHSFDKMLPDIKSAFSASAGVLLVKYCACEAKTDKIRETYKVDPGYWSHCVTTACSAIGLNAGILGGYLDRPADMALRISNNGDLRLHSNCGRSAGDPASIEILRRPDDPNYDDPN